jgi:branched-chain amino acid transport system ATP-binding protein
LRSAPALSYAARGQGRDALLEVRDIHTYYGDSYVLQGVSLRVKGQVVGILGRNGMGKTTLIRSIS